LDVGEFDTPHQRHRVDVSFPPFLLQGFPLFSGLGKAKVTPTVPNVETPSPLLFFPDLRRSERRHSFFARAEMEEARPQALPSSFWSPTPGAGVFSFFPSRLGRPFPQHRDNACPYLSPVSSSFLLVTRRRRIVPFPCPSFPFLYSNDQQPEPGPLREEGSSCSISATFSAPLWRR